MSTLANTRLTVLQIVNEVRQKLSIQTASSLTQDENTLSLLAYLNDVVDMINDFGEWKELAVECTITASTCVRSYLVSTANPLHHIHEIAFEGYIPPLELRSVDDMLRWRRCPAYGVPRNWAIMAVDNVTTGNPYIEVYPVPSANENNSTFNMYVFQKLPYYTSADGAVVVPLPARPIVNALHSLALLDESRDSMDFKTQEGIAKDIIGQAYNRFNGDSGSNPRFVPMYRGKRRP